VNSTQIVWKVYKNRMTVFIPFWLCTGIHCTQIVSEIYMQWMGVVIRFRVHIEVHWSIYPNLNPNPNGYWTTRGLPTRGLDDSRTGHLTDWSTRILDNSQTGQLADAIGDFTCLVFLFGGICQTASCSVRDLSNPRVDQSARYPVRELAIRELACSRVVQLPP